MKLFLTMSIMFLSVISYGQKTWAEVMKGLSVSSEKYLTSFINQDWEDYINGTHPNIVEMAGGKDILIEVASENIKMYQSLGYDLGEVVITEDAETADSEEGLQAIVRAIMILKNGDERIESPMKLYAISADLGETWRFVDLSQYDPQSIKRFVPEFDSGLLEYWSAN